MLREYPVKKPTSAHATGSMLYKFLLKNISIPARANHEIWYAGEKAKLDKPDEYAFRGAIPIGKTLELVTLSGKPVPVERGISLVSGATDYTFTGNEGPVFVGDLSEKAMKELGISGREKITDKVFNPNFKEYKDLDKFTRYSNELAALSFPKSVSSFFGGKGKVNYSEKDVLNFITSCLEDLSSQEMTYVLHGNHLAWASLAFMREDGNVSGDIMTEFYAQNPTDFYVKDLGTILPAIFFTVASLGQDPAEFCDKLDIEVWGAREVALHMRQYLPQDLFTILEKDQFV